MRLLARTAGRWSMRPVAERVAFRCCTALDISRSPSALLKGIEIYLFRHSSRNFRSQALTVAALPRTTRLDVQRFVPTFANPCRSSSAKDWATSCERVFSGIPQNSITSANASITYVFCNVGSMLAIPFWNDEAAKSCR